MNIKIKRTGKQEGFGMIELLVAVTLISMTLLAVGALSSLSATGLALVSRKRAAESYAVGVGSRLKAQQRISLPEGGAFQVEAATGLPVRDPGNRVELNCSNQYCDKIVILAPERDGTSPREIEIGWDEPLPEGASLKFTRAWTLSDEDAVRNWRRVTVAIFATDSNIPVTVSVTGGVIK